MRTIQQSLDIQVAALRKEGVKPHRIFTEKTTSKNSDRVGLDTLRVKVESGDIILIKKLDRLGRKVSIDRDTFVELLAAGMGVSAKEINISRSAVYKLKAELKL